ncbi:MAG: hypothetical protein ACRC0G_02460, partial [Fusobacteriaceae bacterium]
MFKKGDKVKLMNNTGFKHLEVGAIYTVQNVSQTKPNITLVELPEEKWLNIYRFKKVEELVSQREALNDISNTYLLKAEKFKAMILCLDIMEE